MRRARKTVAPVPQYAVTCPGHPLDPVEVNGRGPPLFSVYEDGTGSIPTPVGLELLPGAVFWTCVGYVRVKHISAVVSRPIALRPYRFVWLEWFVGPIR